MGPEPKSKKGKAKMEKSTLFENLLNAPKEIRWDTISNFDAIMGVNDEVMNGLLIGYHTARQKGANEMILELTSCHLNAADAPRILDAAGVRSALVDADSTATVKIIRAFLAAGWQASPAMISDDDGDRPALRLSRA